jgi:nucleotide-binding universal stress UspA family protein
MNTAESRPVVVGYDGSTSSSAALEVGAAEALALGAALHVVHAYVWPILYSSLANVPYRAGEWAPAPSTVAMLQQVADRLTAEHPGLVVTTEVVPGGGGQVLVDASAQAALLVVGASGIGGVAGMLAGSVAPHVASRSHCPVLVVRPGPHPTDPSASDPSGAGPSGAGPSGAGPSGAGPSGADIASTAPSAGSRVVVGVDGTPSSIKALRFACEWAARSHTRVAAVYAVSGADFDEPAPELGTRTPAEARLDGWADNVSGDYPGVVIERSVVRADPGAALLAASRTARLIVVGSRHRGELKSLALGSVGMGLIRHASCPVAVVHGQPTAAAQASAASGPRQAA